MIKRELAGKLALFFSDLSILKNLLIAHPAAET